MATSARQALELIKLITKHREDLCRLTDSIDGLLLNLETRLSVNAREKQADELEAAIAQFPPGTISREPLINIRHRLAVTKVKYQDLIMNLRTNVAVLNEMPLTITEDASMPDKLQILKIFWMLVQSLIDELAAEDNNIEILVIQCRREITNHVVACQQKENRNRSNTRSNARRARAFNARNSNASA
jgi:hypothetical protein